MNNIEHFQCNYEHSLFTVHGNNINAKIKNLNKLNNEQLKALEKIIPEYYNFRKLNNDLTGYDYDVIIKRVESLNNYFNYLDTYTVNGIDKIFTSRGKFRPTVLEEFMYYIFRDLINEIKELLNTNKLKLGSIKAYSNLYFTAKNLNEFLTLPKIRFNEKDQDFSIYREFEFIVEGKQIKTNLPIISIENKTYLDKTMLEGSIATAEKIKNGNPYSLFFIVSETYEVDLKVDPFNSGIDQIYILRKGKRGSGEPKPIYDDVVFDLVEKTKTHLTETWSDIKNTLETSGKIL